MKKFLVALAATILMVAFIVPAALATTPAAPAATTPLATDEIRLVVALDKFHAMVTTDKFVTYGADKQAPVYDLYKHLRLVQNKAGKWYLFVTRQLISRYTDAPVRTDTDRLAPVAKVKMAQIAILGLAEAKNTAEIKDEIFAFEGDIYHAKVLILKELPWHTFGGCSEQIVEEAKKAGFKLDQDGITALTIKKK